MARPLLALLAVLVLVSAPARAQPTTAEAAPDSAPGAGIKVSFRPSVAIVVGIFTMIFSLTFLLLMYAKFCHPSSGASPLTPAVAAAAPLPPPQAQAGLPKPVVESLPFFRFATLRGARQGMECSVCLTRFDDADLLRLLPRCRHAFHLDCVDRWLDSSASCPLCRTRVDAEDAALGLRYPHLGGGGGSPPSGSDDRAGSDRDLLDIFVERVPSSRSLGLGSAAEPQQPPELDRHRHRIIVSDVVFKSRWSELNSADLIALDAEMLRSMSSGRFAYSPPSPRDVDSHPPGPEEDNNRKLAAAQGGEVVRLAIRDETTTETETERKRLLMGTSGVGCSGGSAARMISSGVRSVSDIVSLPRLRAAARERLTEEENRRWLPIARRTARWFAGRGRAKREGEEEEEQGASVHVVTAHVE